MKEGGREGGRVGLLLFSLSVCFAFTPPPGGVSYVGASCSHRIEEIRPGLGWAVFIIN